ncbi:sodium:alanine symporter family protein [Lewinellaceae bacterium SD302]|nr:sodium:alanine symporter family protein [Lewinellaceae bacterium SD302]
MVLLLGTGLWLTVRLGLIQFRYLGHGLAVVSGKYDDPDAPGEVTHFQALTTALSATVGIGNIAGVAIAIHWGGPGAIFWMWVTALLGMATKFSEVTLAQHFRSETADGQVAGGPMYYIEKGLGPNWKPLAMFFSLALITMAMISGNAIQANTLSDLLGTSFGIPAWISGAVGAAIVGLVIIGGIGRIGKVTGILAPLMAALYVLGGLAVIFLHADQILPSFQLIFTEAFSPSAGVAGTGAGVFAQTLIWGVRRGLFSNEAGQGSAPIAHAAARTDEPVSEGVVALLEPLIDTIIICTITALAILCTGVWNQQKVTPIELSSGDLCYLEANKDGYHPSDLNDDILVLRGEASKTNAVALGWHEVRTGRLYIDENLATPFTGHISRNDALAFDEDGVSYSVLYATAVETAAPLTLWAYEYALGSWGSGIVLACVLLFALSTAISWSYYGDRCTVYLFGTKAILPYRVLYIAMHFVGAILSLNLIWEMGDLSMALGTLPNVLALLLLSGLVVKLAKEYFGKIKG